MRADAELALLAPRDAFARRWGPGADAPFSDDFADEPPSALPSEIPELRGDETDRSPTLEESTDDVIELW